MKEVNVKIEGKEWEEALDKAFKEQSKKANIPGFRKGKVPKDVFIKKYGKEALYFDAADIVLNDAYQKMIEENADLKIVAQPQVNLKSIDENGVEFTFNLVLYPEVTLGKYTKLGVKKEKVEATEEEINKTIDEMRNRYAENVVKEGKIEKGDIAIIDFEGFKDGVAFEGGKAENYSLEIGSNSFIPGFEDALIGLKAGESKDIDLTFPEDYHAEDLKGAKVTFKVKVNEVKEVKIPEIDKDFFEDLAMEGINDLDSLKAQVKENILAHKEHHAEEHFVDELVNKAMETMKVDVPHEMIHEEVDRMLRQYEENLKMQGITLEQFYKFTNSDEQALKDQMHTEAERRVKERLLLEAIKEKENITITDEEAEKEAEELAKKYNMKKEEFLNLFGGIEMVKYDKEMRKTLDFLKDNN